MYLPQIDALRAIAAFSVVFFHLYTGVFPKAEIRPLFILADLGSHPGVCRWVAVPSVLGYAGVPLFFVISGFCIHHSHLRASRPFSYLPFMARRFWRIYPAYVVAIVLSLLLPGNLIWKTHHKSKSVLLHLLFLHNFNQTTIFELSGPFWTLALEFQFYAAYPLLLLLRRYIGMLHAALISLLACAIVSVALHQHCLGKLHLPWLPIMYWVQWCLGGLIAERFSAGKPPLFGLPLAFAIWLPGILFAVPVATYGEWNYLAWAVLCAAIIDALIRKRVASSRWFSSVLWLGMISYSIYLLHAILLAQLLPRLPAMPETKFAMGCAILFPLVMVISAANYYFVEKPGIMLGRRIISRVFSPECSLSVIETA